MRSYEQLILDIQNKREQLFVKDSNGKVKITNEQAEPILKEIKKDSLELMELLVFSLIKDRDNFFGNVAVQLHRNIDFYLTADAAVRFRSTYFELSINPLLLVNNTLEEMKAIMVHEMYHIICKHLPRTLPLFKTYNPTILNLAADCAINQYINGLPKGTVTLESLKTHWQLKTPLEPKRELEYYVKGLLNEYAQNNNFSVQVNNNSKDKKSSNNNDNNQEQQQQEQDQNQNNSQQQNGNNQQSSSDTSSNNNTGKPGDFVTEHDYSTAHDNWKKSKSDAGMEDTDDIVKSMLNEAASKSRGTIPSEVQDVMKKLNEKPIISWQEVLRRFIGTLSCPYKKTVMRRDRRQPNRLDLRGRLNDHVAEIVVAIDTSGSMTSEIIEYCMTEVFEIADKSRAKITIIECDAKIQRVYEAKNASDVKPDVTGRGGTCFQPVFDWIRDNNKRNTVLIFFTDGWGESSLDYRPVNKQTLWVLTGKSSDLSLKELYGAEVKELRLDEKWNKRR